MLASSKQEERPLWQEINESLEQDRPTPVEALARRLELETGKSYRKCYFWALEKLKRVSP